MAYNAITLKAIGFSDSERRVFMNEQFALRNLDVSWLDATVLSESNWRAAIARGEIGGNLALEQTYRYQLGTIGCALSHLQCWLNASTMPENDLLVVFEDDVYISNNFKSGLERAVAELPDDFDIAFLCALPTRGDCFIPQERFSHQWLRLENMCITSTAAYILNRRNLAKLLSRTLPILDHIDLHILRQVEQLSTFMFCGWPPLCAGQMTGESERVKVGMAIK
jgi:GR25 family glycosyltransferase involved in LPS biosynthesis